LKVLNLEVGLKLIDFPYLMQKISLYINLFKNMGIRYILFRIFYILKIKSAWLKFRFPTNVKNMFFVSLTKWRKNTPAYFFDSKEELLIRKDKFNFEFDRDELSKKLKNIKDGKITFFSSTEFDLGKNYDWITNPETDYKYEINKHWSLINDFSEKAGDIKYVWEKARFKTFNSSKSCFCNIYKFIVWYKINTFSGIYI